ncbi:MAG: succinate dehydrogenase assembly factor 2 [Alphaproteobacteria bacterium TMED89]|nr:hypothetical protein [Rhodospirillaceae bacterium]RPH19167.1 MAG: succinate dehydrogenase assembly factor 2 [Alphaproteobacteria bacterium TMED89]
MPGKSLTSVKRGLRIAGRTLTVHISLKFDRGRSTMNYADRRKRALWRAGHRGTRELDLLMSQFAQDFLPTSETATQDAAQRMEQIEALQQVNDPDVQVWLQNPDSIPAELPEPLLSALRSFEYRT